MGDSHGRPAPQTLRDYALLADGERGALIGLHGEIVWMCAPRWDSGAVFGDLVGGPGHYTVAPRGRFVGGGHYEPGTLVWRSRWTTSGGITECREALAFPGDPHRAVLLRRITAVQGDARLDLRLEPAADFGRSGAPSFHLEEGVWTARSGDLRLRWSGAPSAHPVPRGGEPAGLAAEVSLAAGEHHDLVLEIADCPLGAVVDASRAWEATTAEWSRTVPALDHGLAPRDSRHAYAVLRGLTSSTGGMVAAATTSLPERARTGRNYDYRYVWIRDQCYAGLAAAAAGSFPLLDCAVDFVSARLLEDGPHMAPAYTVAGERIPGQETLGLEGYPGGFDRVGNWVNRQFQLDAFGEALILLATAHRHGRLEPEGWRAADAAVGAVARYRRRPDAGIWEIGDRAWTHSRLTCAAGLRALAGAAPTAGRVNEWTRLADAMAAETAATSLHPGGRWQRSPEDPGLDASLLLPPLRGALPAGDPRTVNTLRAFVRELTHDHYAYRFRHDGRPLEEAEGAFLLCGFVTALAEHQQGHHGEALRWFERNRTACGPPGLFAEEYDIGQRQMRGNLPQAFVHALMLESAVRLAAPAGSDRVFH
ncbi:glycoside hydrolase family 15 protein [Streptomonospora nanhaiensis]|uniref:Glycoside hydrolase family 15 protein n=1 Tax=Streptomonospora nanhaiensis TaxID=1323731 RepID=A0ABY6YGL7_9ACTN|nr:glycoside hydrolase family 15 protein [Streptomonospora nanhaiensis]WAE71405.1 glycoside hydrolase family 15 protein [Streptomonospora nanhaiensis]